MLVAFELCVHDVELEKPRAVQDMVQVFTAQWHNDLMVAALPIRVATGVDNVSLEVFILANDSLHVRGTESNIRVRRLHLIDWVEQSHGRYNID